MVCLYRRCWLLVALTKWCERVMLTVAVAVSPGWRPAKSAAPNIRCGHPKLYYSLEGLGPWSQMVCGTIFRQLNLPGKKKKTSILPIILAKLLHSDSPDPTSTGQSCQTKIVFPCHPISIQKACIYRICIDRYSLAHGHVTGHLAVGGSGQSCCLLPDTDEKVSKSEHGLRRML